MNRQKFSVNVLKSLIPLLFVLAALMFPSATQLAHGQLVGTVCIAPPSTTSCPSSPPIFTGVVGSQLRVSVNVQGSDRLNGFEIYVKTDPTVLNPTGADLTGSLFSTGVVVVVNNCVNGTGVLCTTLDGPGIVHLAVTINGFIFPAPVTGRFFNINYTIAGSTTGTAIGYQTGCTTSSNDSICVLVVNPFTDPENVQSATFSTVTFTLSASPSTLTITKGTSGTSTLTLTSQTGFSGTVTLSASTAPALSRGPTVSFSPTDVTLTSSGSATSIVTVSTKNSTPMGSYTVTVTATSGSQSKSVQILLTVVHR